MSFNALSLAKLGVGFGALAVASIGLLAPTPVEAESTLHRGGPDRQVVERITRPADWTPWRDTDSDVFIRPPTTQTITHLVAGEPQGGAPVEAPALTRESSTAGAGDLLKKQADEEDGKKQRTAIALALALVLALEDEDD